jgi:hypothetical protein
MSAKRKYGDPAVVPAQPGFRVVTFDGPPTGVASATDASELDAFSKPVIAWVIRPAVDTHRDGEPGEVADAEVHAVPIDGMAADPSYIAGPDGTWTIPYYADFANEAEARSDWLKRELDRSSAVGHSRPAALAKPT